MVEQFSLAGFDVLASTVALLAVAPTIRYVALESEMMRYFRDVSPQFAPLFEMMRMRARYLLRAMTGLFAAFLAYLLCQMLEEFFHAAAAPIAAVFRVLTIGLAAYATIQMLLEIRLTLIGFTYQGVPEHDEA